MTNLWRTDIKYRMRLVYCLPLFLLVASLLVPGAAGADDGCADGSCGVNTSLSPTTGTPGTQVSLSLSGGPFPLDGEYKVYWSRLPLTDEGGGLVIAEGEAPRGAEQITTSFTIPEAVYGVNYIQLRRSRRPEEPYNFAFNVLPQLKVSPASLTPGSFVTLSGAGFAANDGGLKLEFDGKDTQLALASSETGSFTADFTVPSTIAGKHEFKVTTEKIFSKAGVATVTVVPDIKLEPSKPEIGSEVTVVGSGFASKSVVSIRYDDIVVANSPSTDASGNFSYVFAVPESPGADHNVVAADKAGNVATFALPLEGDPPPAPMAVSPKGQRFGIFGSKAVAFNWSEVSDSSGVTYTVEIARDLNFFPLAPGMRKTGLTYTTCVVSLEPGTYYWRVKAADGAGNESGWTLSSQPFKVGFFSIWLLVVAGLVLFVMLLLTVRALFRRINQYY